MEGRNSRMAMRGLSFLHYSALDKFYQQFDGAIGMIFSIRAMTDQKQEKFAPRAQNFIHPDFIKPAASILKRRGIDVVTLAEARKRIMRPKPYERFAVFTVDSVNRHTCDHAFEAFKENDIPYTLYVATGLIEGNGTFVDEAVEELIRRQDRILLQTRAGTFTLDCTSVAGKYRSYAILMNHLRNEIENEAVADRVREICWLYRIDADEIRSESVISWDDVARYDAAQHCSVASGTIGGARLSKLTDDKVKYEITQSCLVLEGVTGIKCRDIAYPMGCKGGVGSREFDIARKARLQTAVTNCPGLIYPEHRKHLHALPRIPLGAAYQRRRYFGPLTTGLPTRLSNYGRRLVFP